MTKPDRFKVGDVVVRTVAPQNPGWIDAGVDVGSVGVVVDVHGKDLTVNYFVAPDHPDVGQTHPANIALVERDNV